MAETFDIDFVITWVDSSDPTWVDSYKRYAYLEDKQYNVSGERFRDWGLLRFWFRAVEEYAPWVRTIHFVTCGQVPTWLNLEHPKLHFVKHEDYMPSRYLPTFGANPIELNLHRIEGLTDHFVYFNDDMYLTSYVRPSDFFMHGLPREVAVRNHPIRYEFGHIVLNDINLINRNLDFCSGYHNNIWKWYNYRYGFHGLRNLFFIPYKDFTGLKETHLPYSLLKSTYSTVWDKCGKELEETSLRKFRSVLNVNIWLLKYWQVVSGNFYPQNRRFGRLFFVNEVESIRKCLHHHSYKTICINDGAVGDVLNLRRDLLAIFKQEFPNSCSFELQGE